MNTEIVRRFIRTTELYLRLTEQQRSANNIDEITGLLFLENNICDKTKPFPEEDVRRQAS